MRRVLASITTAALLSGCVSSLVRQGQRESPRSEAAVVIAGAIGEAALGALFLSGLVEPGSSDGGCTGTPDCGDPIAGVAKGLGTIFVEVAAVVVAGGCAVGDLGIGGAQLASGRYLLSTWVRVTVRLADDELVLDGAPIASREALETALRARHVHSMVLQAPPDTACSSVMAIEDVARRAEVDDIVFLGTCE